MEDHKFTMADAYNVQLCQLANWKTKLNDECYTALAMKCAEEVTKRSEAGDNDPYNVYRGSSMDNFVANWKPKTEQ